MANPASGLFQVPSIWWQEPSINALNSNLQWVFPLSHFNLCWRHSLGATEHNYPALTCLWKKSRNLDLPQPASLINSQDVYVYVPTIYKVVKGQADLGYPREGVSKANLGFLPVILWSWTNNRIIGHRLNAGYGTQLPHFTTEEMKTQDGWSYHTTSK